MELTISSDNSVRTQITIEDHTLRLVARDFHKSRYGWSAEVNILMDQALLAYDSLSLSKQEERTRLAKSAHGLLDGLKDAYTLAMLRHDLDIFCKMARSTWEGSPEYQGQQVVTLKAGGAVTPPEFLLKPLLHRGQPSLIYADGGTGKSVLALIVGLIVSSGWSPNPLKLEAGRPTPVLYLDWETTYDEIQWRLEAIRAGHNVPEGTEIAYRECRRPLSEDVEHIRQIVIDKGIGLVIVDSLGGAVGGDLKENEAANLYFGAIRRLGVSSLSLTHITKADAKGGDATAFGSRYFHNWTRLEWELRSNQAEEEDAIVAGLFHQKHNNTKAFKPVGIRLDFTNNDKDVLTEIRISRSDISGDPVLSRKLPLPLRVRSILMGGALTPEVIAKRLDINKDKIYTALSRMKAKGQVVKLGDTWGLAADDLPF